MKVERFRGRSSRETSRVTILTFLGGLVKQAMFLILRSFSVRVAGT